MARKKIQKAQKAGKIKEHKLLIGVRITSILLYLIAVLLFFEGIALLSIAAGWMDNAELNSLLITNSKISLVIIAISVVAFGIFLMITAINLRRMKNWARISAVIIAILGALSGLNSLMANSLELIILGVIILVINLLILYYLMQKKVKEAFAR